MPWWAPFLATAGTVYSAYQARRATQDASAAAQQPQPPWYSESYDINPQFERLTDLSDGDQWLQRFHDAGREVYQPGEDVLKAESHERRVRDDAFDDSGRYAERDWEYARRSAALSDRYNASAQKRAYEFAERREDNRISRLTGLGLTPQEIAGASPPGGQGSAPSVMTNRPNSADGVSVTQAQLAAAASSSNAQTAARAQLASEEMRSRTAIIQSLIDSGTKIRGQDIDKFLKGRGLDLDERRVEATEDLTEAQVRQVSATIKRIRSETRLTNAQVSNVVAQTEQVFQETRIASVLHDERWPRLFASMSAENVVASVIAAINGADLEAILKAAPGQDREMLRRLIQMSIASRSSALREGLGAAEIGSSIMGGVEDLYDSLRTQPSSQRGQSGRRRRR